MELGHVEKLESNSLNSIIIISVMQKNKLPPINSFWTSRYKS